MSFENNCKEMNLSDISSKNESLAKNFGKSKLILSLVYYNALIKWIYKFINLDF